MSPTSVNSASINCCLRLVHYLGNPYAYLDTPIIRLTFPKKLSGKLGSKPTVARGERRLYLNPTMDALDTIIDIVYEHYYVLTIEIHFYWYSPSLPRSSVHLHIGK